MLTILRDTKVGGFVSLEALGVGRAEEADPGEVEGEEGGAGRPLECVFPLSFTWHVLFSFVLFLRAAWGTGD